MAFSLASRKRELSGSDGEGFTNLPREVDENHQTANNRLQRFQ